MSENHLKRKKEKSLMTFYCFLMAQNLVRLNYFAVMGTVMQLLQFFHESEVE